MRGAELVPAAAALVPLLEHRPPEGQAACPAVCCLEGDSKPRAAPAAGWILGGVSCAEAHPVKCTVGGMVFESETHHLEKVKWSFK